MICAQYFKSPKVVQYLSLRIRFSILWKSPVCFSFHYAYVIQSCLVSVMWNLSFLGELALTQSCKPLPSLFWINQEPVNMWRNKYAASSRTQCPSTGSPWNLCYLQWRCRFLSVFQFSCLTISIWLWALASGLDPSKESSLNS